jgi:hypothetical protein
MNELKYYLLFNPELKKFNLTYIKKQYIEDLNNNNVVSINTFFKKYKDFDINIYKKFNKEIENYSNIDAMVHMNNIGSKNDLIYYEDIYDILPEENKYKEFEKIQVEIDSTKYQEYLNNKLKD